MLGCRGVGDADGKTIGVVTFTTCEGGRDEGLGGQRSGHDVGESTGEKVSDAEQQDGLAGFEAAMQTLEQLVTRMEREELPLEQALAAFEQGMGLVQRCQRTLDLAEQRVQILLGTGDEARLQPLIGDPERNPALAGAAVGRSRAGGAAGAAAADAPESAPEPDWGDDVPF